MSSFLKPVTAAARGLALVGESRGKPFPYQWSFPGRNALPIMAAGSGELAGAAGTVECVRYTVSRGHRLVLTGVIFDFFGVGWSQGGSDLLLSVSVVGAAGSRPLQFLTNVRTELGSVTEGAFMLPASLMFLAGDVLVGNVVETGVVPALQRMYMQLYGFEAPESEFAR